MVDTFLTMKNNPLDKKIRKVVAAMHADGQEPHAHVPEIARRVKVQPQLVRYYLSKFALEAIRAKGGGK